MFFLFSDMQIFTDVHTEGVTQIAFSYYQLNTRLLMFSYIHRGGSSPKILGGGALPHQPLHHRVHFLHSPKPEKYEKYELHIGLLLKSIISRVASSQLCNGLDIETHRNEA